MGEKWEIVSNTYLSLYFCYERRGEVIDYVRRKYGNEAVSGIVTFGTFAARSSVRDVTRVTEYPYALGDKIAKTIPATPGMTLEKAFDESPEFLKLYNEDAGAKKIIDGALKIEGLPRHSSTHACGLIISDTSVDEYMPEFMAGTVKEGKQITSQVTMSEVEDLGLLKFDFLGLKTMSVIGRSLNSIKRVTSENINYLDIPLNDPYIYEYIGTGRTEGVFQLESQGMRGFMKDLYSDVSYLIKKTERKYNLRGFKEIKGEGKERKKYKEEMEIMGQELFERLIAGIALYRPGPLDYIPNYIEGIRNPDSIEYLTPELEPILEATYGTIIYQEQVMKIVQTLAGYSLGRADIMRRAMGKKELDVMAKEKDFFINGKLDRDGNIEVQGCIRNGIKKEASEEIWEQMAHFSSYAFNKSHAAVYAMLGAVTGWLKLYYPAIFMAETMNIFRGDTDKLNMYLNVTEKMNLSILPPDLNTSYQEFSSDGENIRFGMGALAYMGKKSDEIISEREERGSFDSFEDFIDRMIRYQKTDKRAFEGLIYSGALDNYRGTRKAKIDFLPKILKERRKSVKNLVDGQVSMGDIGGDLEEQYNKSTYFPDTEEFNKRYMLEKEKEFAGFYVTEHPLDEYMPYLSNQGITEISDLVSDTVEDDTEDGLMADDFIVEEFRERDVNLVGIISDTKTFYTKKKGEPLKVFKIEDKSGEIKGVMFSDKIDNFGIHISEGNIVYLAGTLKEDDFGRQIIVNSIKSIEDIKEEKKEEYIMLKAINEKQINELSRKILNIDKYKGNTVVYLSYNNEILKANKTIDVEKSASVIQNIFHDYNTNQKVI